MHKFLVPRTSRMRYTDETQDNKRLLRCQPNNSLKLRIRGIRLKKQRSIWTKSHFNKPTGQTYGKVTHPRCSTIPNMDWKFKIYNHPIAKYLENHLKMMLEIKLSLKRLPSNALMKRKLKMMMQNSTMHRTGLSTAIV